MLRNRSVQVAGIILFLILANIVNYLYWNWGLITVKVTDAPLNKVISSIEWQGWVRIYTNFPPDSTVSMYVDHVPLAEAMESLAANVTPPPDANPPDRPGGDAPPGGPPPPGGAPPGGPGGPGGRGGGFGRGGFGGGGGAQWNLAFFVAPTSAQVKAEIQAFQSGTPDDDLKVYTYPTPFQMVASDDDMPAADPRAQSWPGYKPPAPPPAPTDGSAPSSPDPAAADTNATPTVHTYLQAFAQSANVWIMAPASWDPTVTSPPPANSSLIRAIKNFISSSRGSVTQAIILRRGRGGARGGTRGGGGFADIDATADRLRNAINGLPEEARADALTQLDQEVKFFHDVQLAPPEDRPKMIREHMMSKRGNGFNRMSPQKRAQMYARLVANREAAQGKK
jgi:hypothetical protein